MATPKFFDWVSRFAVGDPSAVKPRFSNSRTGLPYGDRGRTCQVRQPRISDARFPCSPVNTIRAIWRRRVRVHHRSVVSKDGTVDLLPRRVIALIEFRRDGFDPQFLTMPEGEIRWCDAGSDRHSRDNHKDQL